MQICCFFRLNGASIEMQKYLVGQGILRRTGFTFSALLKKISFLSHKAKKVQARQFLQKCLSEKEPGFIFLIILIF